MADEVASSRETVEALLVASKRTTLPLRRAFVQSGGPRQRSGAGSLARFVRAHHLRALDQYLLFHAVASAAPFNVARDARVWARALGLGESASSLRAVSKNWAWLRDIGLVTPGRVGRTSAPSLLCEDRSGEPYKHPSLRREAYFQVPYAYWREGWDMRLDLAAKAMLLIALSLQEGFILPHEKAPAWYGISADTASRGLKRLEEEGLVELRRAKKKAPLAPLGFTYETRYSLRGAFSTQRRGRATA